MFDFCWLFHLAKCRRHNSVYSEFADFFSLLVIIVVLINEVAFHNPNNPRHLEEHTPMLMSSMLFHNIPFLSFFLMKSLSKVFGFCYHFFWMPWSKPEVVSILIC